MRAAVVINPTKVGDVAKARVSICAVFVDAGLAEPAWYETTMDDPGFGQARRAVAEGAEVVFACGGDGTVRACAHELAGSEVALAILPAGTGNLLVANLALPTEVAAVVAAAATGRRRRIDLGQLDGTHFAVMAGLGFDADMMEATPDRWKRRIGWPAYVIGGLRRLRDRPIRVSISLDGGPFLQRTARTVLIANVGRLQGGLDLFGDALPDDGALDVAVISPRGLWQWFGLALAVTMRRRPDPAHLETFRAAAVEIHSQNVVARQMDGDPIAPGRVLRVAVQPAALLICVPSEPLDA